MDFCCCLVGWMCLGGLFEICPPVIVMELTLHSSRQRSGQVTPCAVWVQSQDMISVCAGVWGYFYPSGRRDLGAGPCWGLAKIPVSSLVSGSPGWSLSGTGFTPFHQTRARIYIYIIYLFFFFQFLSFLSLPLMHP